MTRPVQRVDSRAAQLRSEFLKNAGMDIELLLDRVSQIPSSSSKAG